MNNHPDKRSFSIGQLRTFESFKYRTYRIYYASMAGNWIAQSMQMITRSLLVFRLTDSAVSIGIMALANALPAILTSLWGGAVADRISKKYILLVCRLSLALIALATALALTFGIVSTEHPGSWWLIVLAAGLEGIVNNFMMPANMSIVPEIVEEKQVMNAISLSSIGQNLFRLISPILAGWLIDSCGFSIVYFVMTALYLAGSCVTVFLPDTGSNPRRTGSTFSNMIDSLRYLKTHTVILVIIGFALLHTLAGQPYAQLLPVITETVLKISATRLGILTAVSGVGAVIGALILASLPAKRRGALLMLSGVIMGVPLMVFSASHWWYLSLALMPFIGLGPTMHGAMTSILIQTYVERDFRGRMQSLFTMSSGLSSLGTFVAGLLTTFIGVQWSLAGLAFILAAGSVLFMFLFPGLRKLD